MFTTDLVLYVLRQTTIQRSLILSFSFLVKGYSSETKYTRKYDKIVLGHRFDDKTLNFLKRREKEKKGSQFLGRE